MCKSHLSVGRSPILSFTSCLHGRIDVYCGVFAARICGFPNEKQVICLNELVPPRQEGPGVTRIEERNLYKSSDLDEMHDDEKESVHAIPPTVDPETRSTAKSNSLNNGPEEDFKCTSNSASEDEGSEDELDAIEDIAVSRELESKDNKPVSGDTSLCKDFCSKSELIRKLSIRKRIWLAKRTKRIKAVEARRQTACRNLFNLDPEQSWQYLRNIARCLGDDGFNRHLENLQKIYFQSSCAKIF